MLSTIRLLCHINHNHLPKLIRVYNPKSRLQLDLHLKSLLNNDHFHGCIRKNDFSTCNYLRNQKEKHTIKSTTSTSTSGGANSSGNGNNDDESGSNEPEDESLRQAALEQEKRIRKYKKIFSTCLFTGTVLLALYARQRNLSELEKNVEGCVCLGSDENFEGPHKIFFKCKNVVKDDKSGQMITTECVLPSELVTKGIIRAVKDFDIKQDDIIVASFPKTGTSWLQEITYLIVNDLDFKKAKEEVLETRFPYLEYPYPGLHTVEKMKSPRLIKTHLPYEFLPKNVSNAKIIYITRNPKDTVVSYYHFARMLSFSSYKGSFNDFVEKFKSDKLPYAPFFENLSSYLNRKDDPNILILTYEELSKNPFDVIRKIGFFLQKPMTDNEIELIVQHTNFENMKKNDSVNYEHWNDLGIRNKNESNFMRKGKVGDWKSYFNSESNQSFDLWEKEANKIGFKFEYEFND